MCSGSDPNALPGESTSHREHPNWRLCQARQCDLLLGGISIAVLWLAVSVCSDFCTVLWHAIRFESMYYLCGLCFRQYRRRTKRGGSYGLAPPALHRLAGGQFWPDGKCLFCSLLWAHANVELAVVRFFFGSRVGTLFELFWDFHVRRVKKWGHISSSLLGLAFRRFLVAGSEGRVFSSSEVF